MDYTDFLTRLFKKTGGKYYHLILDTIASRVKMADGSTVEDSIEANRIQTASAKGLANTAYGASVSAYNKAQEALDSAESKLERATAAAQLAGDGLTATGNKLNVDYNAVGDIVFYDDIIDFTDEEQLEEIAETIQRDSIVVYDCGEGNTKCLAVKTEDGLEKTAGSDSVTMAVKLAALERLAMQNFAPNDEIWITESGDFTVPYDGLYEITIWNGGSGCYQYSDHRFDSGGAGYAPLTTVRYYKKGAIIPVTIGAGGKGSKFDSNISPHGGISSFDGITVPHSKYYMLGSSMLLREGLNVVYARAYGGGVGGGLGDPTTGVHAQGYGAGGGGFYDGTNDYVGDGGNGAVRLCFFNPEKASLPAINDTDMIPYIELLQRIEALEQAINTGE